SSLHPPANPAIVAVYPHISPQSASSAATPTPALSALIAMLASLKHACRSAAALFWIPAFAEMTSCPPFDFAQDRLRRASSVRAVWETRHGPCSGSERIMRSLHITDKIRIIENGLSAKQIGFTHTRRCKPSQTQDSRLRTPDSRPRTQFRSPLQPPRRG